MGVGRRVRRERSCLGRLGQRRTARANQARDASFRVHNIHKTQSYACQVGVAEQEEMKSWLAVAEVD